MARNLNRQKGEEKVFFLHRQNRLWEIIVIYFLVYRLVEPGSE
jgi:hypothetical protein